MDPTDDENHSDQHDNSEASGGAEVSQEESNEKDDTKLQLLKDTEETTNSDIKDMPPSYSGLLSEPANSLPCYKVVSNSLIRWVQNLIYFQDIMKSESIEEILNTAKETQLL